jgi:hypothetical protein
MRKHRPEAMDLLTRVTPDLDGAPDPQQRARDLTKILAQPHGQATRAPERPAGVRHPITWTTAVGMTAIATAVAVAVAVLAPSRRDADRPQPGSEQVIAAEQVLLAAARRAEAQPATTGRWWHTERRHLATTPFAAGQGHDAFSFVMEGVIANWSPARGKQAWEGGTKPYYRFPTPKDEANWRRAGEPVKPGPSGDKRPGFVQRHRDPRVLKQPPTPQHRIDGPAFWVLGRTGLTVRDVQRLPTTPAALQRVLLSMRWPERDGARAPADTAQWLWDETLNMLAEWPVTSRTRAAAYRMLAHLPGIRSIGRVTDPLGRTGVAVGRTGHDRGFGTVEKQFIFDPDTSAFLASQTMLRAPTVGTAIRHPGTRLAYYALGTAGWVDQPPLRPARVGSQRSRS